jgi:CysZ protein
VLFEESLVIFTHSMKRFFSQLFTGFKAYGSAIQLVIDRKLYGWFLVPLVVMIGIYFFGEWVSSLQRAPKVDQVRTMNDMVWYALSQHSLDLAGTIISKFSKYLVVVLLSPMFAYISERVEEFLTENVYPFSLQQTIHDVKRGVRIALRNILWEYFFLIVVIGLTVFLEGGIKTALFLSLPLLVGFFYYGFGFIDYINERRRLNIEQSIYFARRHRGLAMAIGSVYSLLFLMPLDFKEMLDFSDFSTSPVLTIVNFLIHVVGWVMISCAPILAIMAATIAMHETVDLSSNEYAQKKSVDNS